MKNILTPKEALEHLDIEKWAKADVDTKLNLMYEVRDRLAKYSKELAQADANMKNKIVGDDSISNEESEIGTVVPLGNNLMAAISMYEYIKKNGEMPKGIKETKVKDGLYDILTFPRETKDKVLYGSQKHILRVKGEPKQLNPFERKGGIIAVLGAGNYSSSLEMVKALFYDNFTVIHKPHHINEETDKVWAKIFKPLIDFKALAFCAGPGSRDLVNDPRLDKIYFTGGADTAQKIMSSSKAEFVSECGGNNPCIVVPGIRKWTKKEIRHQAIQIATISKLNGGAVCGRIQTLVTSKNWEQREEFLEALEKAIIEETPATGTYYPGSEEKWNGFETGEPTHKILSPEGGKKNNSKFMFIKGIGEDSYGVKNEAFCQIISEVPLDVSSNPKEFLEEAVHFCNTKLLGTLGSSIIIDETTRKQYEKELENAVTDMNYGGISVNTMPPFIFLSPYLTWGGNEKVENFVSGQGNFGNALCYQNVEKSILYDDFMSMSHMMNTNKESIKSVAIGMSNYSLYPTYKNLLKMIGIGIRANLRKKDF